MGGIGDLYFEKIVWNWVLEGGINMGDRSIALTTTCSEKRSGTESMMGVYYD
jgi:hypothetical protein